MPPVSGTSAVRVNAGGGAYTDPAGRVWSSDSGFNLGASYVTGASVSGTTTPALYQSEHWHNAPFQYQVSLPNGSYNVNLKFAEIFFQNAGQRIFNVSINGAPALTNFDIVAQAGGAFKALDKQFTVNVTSGTIVIQFVPVLDNPKISAIEIVPAPATAIRVNAGGGSYTDSTGVLWAADNGFSGGSVYQTSSAISGTTVPAIYQTERYSPGTLRYTFSAPNGSYTAKLRFAELYYSTPGKRVFNVIITGTTVLSNFDIVAAAGAKNAAVDMVFPVSVTTGQITLQFVSLVENAKINAIEIY
jgi:hypothetical protein